MDDAGQMKVAEQIFRMRKVRVIFHLDDGSVLEGHVLGFTMSLEQTSFKVGPLEEKK